MWLGANLGTTRWGRPLRDGGACLLDEGGPIAAIAEERLSRKKHAGGWTRSRQYCIEIAGTTPCQIELAVLTSCCEPVRAPDSLDEYAAELGFRVDTVSHHLAHAYSAYWPSGFDEAIVVVLDGGGNTFEQDAPRDWWRAGREQATYYIGSGDELWEIARDFDRPYEVGFGELYRAFTHYLGWPSSTLAGNTMALAAFGERRWPGRTLFEVDRTEARLSLPIAADPAHPIEMIQRLLSERGINAPSPRTPRSGFKQVHADLARLAQDSLYAAVRWRLSDLVKRTGIRKVCVAGGVALNCVMIGRLLEEGVFSDVFVQPAAGDTGQCLGAAYVALMRCGGRRPAPASSFSPFLGRRYNSTDIQDGVRRIEASRIRVDFIEGDPEITKTVAKLIAAGKTVGWFAGRSEFGPRALGARSILADPRSVDVKKKLLSIKGREHFMPFAPSVLADSYDKYFTGSGSDTMTVAVTATSDAHKLLPAVIHHDGSARVQKVAHDQGSFAKLLRDFGEIANLEVLLNTSFNLAGEPMVDSPADCASAFVRSDLDCLYLDGLLIVKQ
ncbi:MAG TPA: carbamoyltransferase C-terminal domain-containing protein [Actinophytocola sp.]|uniref:carbamoyltransferase C-terminal domain-containing protein n=1 Tax=Actinophytocola sp. TaxID=1872138 RepID=UPI002DDCCE13|nr:carbamoyltransferase C-terminal domain-containing protein [Actinophytocola sp.]HEV2783057.1 carbamoyltransferase C-terminal domain-containing protein [Actinophytocola sp.]